MKLQPLDIKTVTPDQAIEQVCKGIGVFFDSYDLPRQAYFITQVAEYVGNCQAMVRHAQDVRAKAATEIAPVTAPLEQVFPEPVDGVTHVTVPGGGCPIQSDPQVTECVTTTGSRLYEGVVVPAGSDDDARYAGLEKEHLGDADAKTGIYAETPVVHHDIPENDPDKVEI